MLSQIMTDITMLTLYYQEVLSTMWRVAELRLVQQVSQLFLPHLIHQSHITHHRLIVQLEQRPEQLIAHMDPQVGILLRQPPLVRIAERAQMAQQLILQPPLLVNPQKQMNKTL